MCSPMANVPSIYLSFYPKLIFISGDELSPFPRYAFPETQALFEICFMLEAFT